MDPSANTQEGAPPLAGVDQPVPNIPGKDRLDEAVGKAIGGTVIPSDLLPSDMPSTTKIDAEKADLPPELKPQQQPNQPGKDTGDKTKEGPKPKTAHPVETNLGWSQAYKPTDGPQNEFREKSIWMEDFARSALFSSFWTSAAVTFTIPAICYIAFKLGGGFISLILIIAFGGTVNTIARHTLFDGTSGENTPLEQSSDPTLFFFTTPNPKQQRTTKTRFAGSSAMQETILRAS